MKFWITALLALLFVSAPLWAAPQAAAPKYDSSKESTFKGTITEVKDRECPVSHGMGSHFMLKLADGKTYEVHVAKTSFVKDLELVFKVGDEVEVTGVKLTFQDADAILAREIKLGNDLFTFRDKSGKPVW
jgi:DNA/RNA endonuclease YhcR with UshA esterase domain